MAWVKGSGLRVGDVIFSWKITGSGETGRYHHPFLVTAVNATSVNIGNCTSHTSASFTTIEIPDADKGGNSTWKSGRSSYFVTDGDHMTVPMKYEYAEYAGTEDVEVTQAFTQTVQNMDGSLSFKHYKPGDLFTRPVLVPRHSDMEYFRIGTVSERWRKAHL